MLELFGHGLLFEVESFVFRSEQFLFGAAAFCVTSLGVQWPVEFVNGRVLAGARAP